MLGLLLMRLLLPLLVGGGEGRPEPKTCLSWLASAFLLLEQGAVQSNHLVLQDPPTAARPRIAACPVLPNDAPHTHTA